MKKTLRKAMLPTICMLVVAVMSLTGVTYAWFTQGTTADVTGMKVEVSAADGGIQLRKVEGGSKTPWASSLNLDTTLSSVAPISSADGENFFGITVSDSDSSKYTVQKIEDTDAFVITKNIQLSNPGATPVTVALNEESVINAAANAGKTTDIHNAARVALIVTKHVEKAVEDGEEGETEIVEEKTTYIWAPEGGTYVALYGAIDTPENYLVATNNVSKEVTLAAGEDCEIYLPANPEMAENELLIVDVTVVVWLEGQDSDCKNSNAGGAFDVVLQLEVQ